MISVLRHSFRFILRWFDFQPLFYYTFKRFVKYSAREDSEESLIGNITMRAHGIEKGLTMGDFRAGFGRERLLNLLDGCEDYISKYGLDNIQIHHIATVINDYKVCHQKLGYKLDEDIIIKIDHFLSNFDCPSDSNIQINCTRDTYFNKNHGDFAEFCKSRHSCRDFDGTPIPVEKIDKAIGLAQTSPSACNRQPARIYVIDSKDKIVELLSLHGGNKGFTHKIDKLIMVCGFIPCYGPTERNCVFTDCGIFAMNLAYSLHYNEIGACILNWSVNTKKDKAARKLLEIPNEEEICCLIACGNVPEAFKVCNSRKKEINSIVHHI